MILMNQDLFPLAFIALITEYKTSRNVLGMNFYNVYFVSKGTGPQTVQIEAQNSAGVKAQVEARYPGAYNITLNQLPTSAKKKRE